MDICWTYPNYVRIEAEGEIDGLRQDAFELAGYWSDHALDLTTRLSSETAASVALSQYGDLAVVG